MGEEKEHRQPTAQPGTAEDSSSRGIAPYFALVRAKVSGLDQFLLGLATCLSAILALIVLGYGVYNAVVELNNLKRWTGSGYRAYFSVPFFLAFTIPFVCLTAVLSIGGIGIMRFRGGPVTTRGATAGFTTRWCARASALLVITVAFVGTINFIRAISYPSGSQRWSILNLVLVTGCVLLSLAAVHTLRSASFRLGWKPAFCTLVVSLGVFLIPYGSYVIAGRAVSASSGFQGLALAPDPHLVEPGQVECGYKSHCIIAGVIAGLPNQVGLGIATTADGGLSWHTISIPKYWQIGTISCSGSRCWGIGQQGSLSGAMRIISIHIRPDGLARIRSHDISPIQPDKSQPVGTYSGPATSTCTSASHCVVITSITNRTLRRSTNGTELVSSMTTNAGASWTHNIIAVAPENSPALPDGGAHAGVQCDEGGTCVLIVKLVPAGCTNVPCPASLAVLRSVNGGVSWIASQPEGMPRVSTNTVLDPSCQGLPVCTVSTFTPGEGGIYSISLDAGKTWRPFGGKGIGTVKCSPTGECMQTMDISIASASTEVSMSFNMGHSWVASPTNPVEMLGIASMGCSTTGQCLLTYARPPSGKTYVLTASSATSWSLRKIPPPATRNRG